MGLIALGHASDEHVEHRRQQQTEEQYPEHAREHSRAQGMADLRARASRYHQRHHAHDERERRHQDWTQAHASRLQHRRDGVMTLLLLQMLGEFHDQNRVLASEAYQYDETHLGEDVVIAMVE